MMRVQANALAALLPVTQYATMYGLNERREYSMSNESAATEGDGLPEAINHDVGQLIHHLRCSNAPDEVLAEATKHIQLAMEALKPWLQAGGGLVNHFNRQRYSGFPWQEDDLTAVMPYSPVSGKRNPIAPPIKMWKSVRERCWGGHLFTHLCRPTGQRSRRYYRSGFR